MVIIGFSLIFVAPSALIGWRLARRLNRVLTFLIMMAVFFLTVLTAWSSLDRLLTSNEGLLILIVQILVALTVLSVRLPGVSYLHHLLRGPTHS